MSTHKRKNPIAPKPSWLVDDLGPLGVPYNNVTEDFIPAPESSYGSLFSLITGPLSS